MLYLYLREYENLLESQEIKGRQRNVSQSLRVYKVSGSGRSLCVSPSIVQTKRTDMYVSVERKTKGMETCVSVYRADEKNGDVCLRRKCRQKERICVSPSNVRRKEWRRVSPQTVQTKGTETLPERLYDKEQRTENMARSDERLLEQDH
jgi:hypothetical protein